jgi:tripartite-type tricarboxylate transporter receptor subunit TctC
MSQKNLASIRFVQSRGASALSALALALAVSAPAMAWEPTKPVEFIVPAGTGGGADQMARFVQGVDHQEQLMKQPMIVVNKSGGAGADFLAMKDAKVIRTRSSSRSRISSPPLATGVPFSWKDLTPVCCWHSISSCCG